MVHKDSIRKLSLVLLASAISCASVNMPISRARDLGTSDQLMSATKAKPGVPVTSETPGFEAVQHGAQRSAHLLVSGSISPKTGAPVSLDMETLKTLQGHSISTSTVVTDGVLTFEGVLMRSVLDYVGAQGQTVTARALNGYEVEIPIQDFMNFDVLLAWSVNGTRLKSDDKGPFWIVYPRDQHDVLQDIRYDYRWVWQLISLQVN